MKIIYIILTKVIQIRKIIQWIFLSQHDEFEFEYVHKQKSCKISKKISVLTQIMRKFKFGSNKVPCVQHL